MAIFPSGEGSTMVYSILTGSANKKMINCFCSKEIKKGRHLIKHAGA